MMVVGDAGMPRTLWGRGMGACLLGLLLVIGAFFAVVRFVVFLPMCQLFPDRIGGDKKHAQDEPYGRMNAQYGCLPCKIEDADKYHHEPKDHGTYFHDVFLPMSILLLAFLLQP